MSTGGEASAIVQTVLATPTEPRATPWEFPSAEEADEFGLVAVGADLKPGTILSAYRRGMFPMPIDGSSKIGWWSPTPRGVLELDQLQVSRSLQRSVERYRVTENTAFLRVIQRCADPDRDGGWITPEILDAYTVLHDLGWAHSVESWDDNGALAGGLYGVSIGGLFCGESMFFESTDASKVALMHLVARLRANGAGLLDVQWETEHLRTLGVTSVSRSSYLRRIGPLVNASCSASLSKS